MKVADVIRENTRKHLLGNNGLLFGQCVRAVGNIGGTVPDLTEDEGIIEVSTSDVANSGWAVGAALAGRRPIYAVRYQGFLWYNAATVVNYAAKSKFLWNKPCPIFVRAIAMEGGMGPVATGSHHSMIMHMPGINVVSPMTPNEWQNAWDDFMSGDDPVFASEHRLSFNNEDEIVDVIVDNPDIVVLAISASRFNAVKAVNIINTGSTDINVAFYNICSLKPLKYNGSALDALSRAKIGVVFDCDFTLAGASEHVAYKLMYEVESCTVIAKGLDDRTAGFSPQSDNKTMSVDDMVRYIIDIEKRFRDA